MSGLFPSWRGEPYGARVGDRLGISRVSVTTSTTSTGSSDRRSAPSSMRDRSSTSSTSLEQVAAGLHDLCRAARAGRGAGRGARATRRSRGSRAAACAARGSCATGTRPWRRSRARPRAGRGARRLRPACSPTSRATVELDDFVGRRVAERPDLRLDPDVLAVATKHAVGVRDDAVVTGLRVRREVPGDGLDVVGMDELRAKRPTMSSGS